MKRFLNALKNFLKAAAVILLSYVSAYLAYFLLLALNVVHYYELAEPGDNIQAYLTLILSFIAFGILYGFLFFRRKK